MNSVKNSSVAWALGIISGLASMMQGNETIVPVLFVCAGLICGAVERRNV